MDICFERPNGALDDQADANGSSQVENYVRFIDKLRQKMFIRDRIEKVVKILLRLQVADILDAARRKVVQNKNVISTVQQCLRKMGADEAGTACD